MRDLARLLDSDFGPGEGGVEVDDGVFEISGDFDARESEFPRGIDAARGSISWILFAGNIFGVNVAFCVCKDVMNADENSVCGLVMAPSVPPSLNNTLVVSMHPKVLFRFAERQDVDDGQFEVNRFSPPNVSVVAFPPR
jgi:hypothetical protein